MRILQKRKVQDIAPKSSVLFLDIFPKFRIFPQKIQKKIKKSYTFDRAPGGFALINDALKRYLIGGKGENAGCLGGYSGFIWLAVFRKPPNYFPKLFGFFGGFPDFSSVIPEFRSCFSPDAVFTVVDQHDQPPSSIVSKGG